MIDGTSELFSAVLGCSVIADASVPVEAECEVICISVSVHIALHIVRYILELLLYGLHVCRKLHRKES